EEEEKLKKEKRDVILVDQNFKYNRIYTVSINLNELGKRDIKQLISGAYHVNDFNWSPDGSTIVFSYRPDPGLNWTFLESDISIIPSDSGKVMPIITQPGLDFNPIYSPDGKWIAFQSNGGKPEPVGVSDLYKVQARGGNILELKKSPDRRAQIISWSQDGSHLFITETYKTSQTLFALPSDNNGKALQGDFVAYSDSKLAILTSLQGTSRSFSISQSGNRMSYTYQDTDKPVEVFIADLKGANSRKISSVNDDFNPPRMGKTELISWNSTDGTAIEGLLTYPAEFKKGEKYPIVLQIHGGPFGVFRKNYTGEPSIYMTQYFAQNGFIILRPNPRGSSGYGKKFRFANVNDWGFGDYEDLISGVDHVLSMGIADSDQQFVMGWSYGGYMTSWVVTQTDRFKAASMGAGLPNLISMVTTTDIPDFIVAHMGGQEFWEDYKEYERHSAIYQIAKVKTPTQVIHGANDLRVPFAQGMEFYNALKRKGVDTEMVVYPRTPHGPTEP
ncbi:S9 family peptidase, partial [bacterium]|nr:S9 family peptidase [bacterium]